MQKMLIASVLCAICCLSTIAQENFEGTLHYTHQIRYEDNNAFSKHREKLKEMSNKIAYPQIAMLKAGELAHRRSYTILPDRLLSTIRDAEGKQILEYRVQRPNYAFRVDHESETITNPMLIVEKREKSQRAKRKGTDTFNGYDCEVFVIKYKGGELELWVTSDIVLPTHVGYFSELLLYDKVIVRSIDHNKAEGRYEELQLAHVDNTIIEISDADLLELECLYKDSRTVERRMLVQSAGLRKGK